jgi:hypothetical protein
MIQSSLGGQTHQRGCAVEIVKPHESIVPEYHPTVSSCSLPVGRFLFFFLVISFVVRQYQNHGKGLGIEEQCHYNRELFYIEPMCGGFID